MKFIGLIRWFSYRFELSALKLYLPISNSWTNPFRTTIILAQIKRWLTFQSLSQTLRGQFHRTTGLCLDYNTVGYICLFVQVGEMSGVVETDSGVHVIKRTA